MKKDGDDPAPEKTKSGFVEEYQNREMVGRVGDWWMVEKEDLWDIWWGGTEKGKAFGM